MCAHKAALTYILCMYIVETMLYVVICLLRGTDNCFLLTVKVELGGNEQLAFPQIGCLFLPGNLGYFTVYLFASRLALNNIRSLDH